MPPWPPPAGGGSGKKLGVHERGEDYLQQSETLSHRQKAHISFSQKEPLGTLKREVREPPGSATVWPCSRFTRNIQGRPDCRAMQKWVRCFPGGGGGGRASERGFLFTAEVSRVADLTCFFFASCFVSTKKEVDFLRPLRHRPPAQRHPSRPHLQTQRRN